MVRKLLLGIVTVLIIVKLMTGLCVSWWLLIVPFLLILASLSVRVLLRLAILIAMVAFVVEINSARKYGRTFQ